MGIVSPILGGSLESPLICGIFVGFVGPWGKKKGSSLECILGYMGLPKTDLWMSILDRVVGGWLFSTRYGVGFGRWFVFVKEKGHFASPTNHLEHVTTWWLSFQPMVNGKSWTRTLGCLLNTTWIFLFEYTCDRSSCITMYSLLWSRLVGVGNLSFQWNIVVLGNLGPCVMRILRITPRKINGWNLKVTRL